MLYVQQKLNLDARSAGLILGYVGLLAVIIQVAAIGKLTKQFSEEKLIKMASFTLILSYMCWALTPNLFILLIVLIPISAASSVLNTVLRSGLTKAVTSEEIGGILGFSTSLESMTNIVTPVIGGFLIGSVGTWATGAFSGLIMVILFLYALRHISFEKNEKVEPVQTQVEAVEY